MVFAGFDREFEARKRQDRANIEMPHNHKSADCIGGYANPNTVGAGAEGSVIHMPAEQRKQAVEQWPVSMQGWGHGKWLAGLVLTMLYVPKRWGDS